MLVPIVFVDLPIKNGKARNSHGSGTDTQCLLQYQCLEKRWSLVNPCLSCEKHKRSSYIVWLRWFQTWNIMKYLFVAMAISWLCQVSLNHCELMIILFVGGLGWWPLQAIISGLYLRFFAVSPWWEAKGTGCGGFPMDHYRLATWFRAPSEHQELQRVEPRNVLPKTPPGP